MISLGLYSSQGRSFLRDVGNEAVVMHHTDSISVACGGRPPPCWSFLFRDTPHFWRSTQTFYIVFVPARQKCGVSQKAVFEGLTSPQVLYSNVKPFRTFTRTTDTTLRHHQLESSKNGVLSARVWLKLASATPKLLLTFTVCFI
jgi:hypothetical protein